ncbi:MAG: hypothetical protein WKI04_17410 [Ferruginibacter sp.]
MKARSALNRRKPLLKMISAIPITAPDILHIDSNNNLVIRVNGKLIVQYSNDPAAKKFLKRNIYIAGDLDKGVESIINFKTTPLGLNNAGVLSEPTEVEYTGYWQYERAANLLPYDYVPE